LGPDANAHVLDLLGNNVGRQPSAYTGHIKDFIANQFIVFLALPIIADTNIIYQL
jgi:hypothetical protein